MSDRRITALERAYEKLAREYAALQEQVADHERRLRALEAVHRAEPMLAVVTDEFEAEAPHG